MSEKIPFDLSGPVKRYAYVEGDDLHMQEVEDAEPLVNLAKAMSDMPAGKADGMRLEAYVPMTVLEQAYREGWYHDKAAWKRWANDPANKRFRVEHNGRVNRL